MSEQEKYWGCTPVLTTHMEARMKASREYAKMVSNDDETPAQRANRARDFECGAIWEEGYYKKHGWHPVTEPPKEGDEVVVITLGGMTAARAIYSNGIYYSVVLKKAYYPSVEYWCYPPKEE